MDLNIILSFIKENQETACKNILQNYELSSDIEKVILPFIEKYGITDASIYKELKYTSAFDIDKMICDLMNGLLKKVFFDKLLKAGVNMPTYLFNSPVAVYEKIDSGYGDREYYEHVIRFNTINDLYKFPINGNDEKLDYFLQYYKIVRDTRKEFYDEVKKLYKNTYTSVY